LNRRMLDLQSSALGHLAMPAWNKNLEREKGIEPSKRDWKSRMLPITSLPRKLNLGTPGRTRTRTKFVRSESLFQIKLRGLGKIWSIVPDLNRCFRHGKPVSSDRAGRTMLELSMVRAVRIELTPQVSKTRMQEATTPCPVRNIGAPGETRTHKSSA
jgi:hypothetical protein